jgi:hypothetical protein
MRETESLDKNSFIIYVYATSLPYLCFYAITRNSLLQNTDCVPQITQQLNLRATLEIEPTGCTTSLATPLLRVVSQLSVDQYCSTWAHFKARYTFDLL